MRKVPDHFLATICSRRRLLGLASGSLLASRFALADEAVLTPMAGLPPAPPVILSDMNGRVVTLSDLRGKVVVVNFWASWCVPCRTEFPSLGRLTRLFQPTELAILAVNVGEKPETITAFLAQPGFSLGGRPGAAVLLDRDSATYKSWQVKGLPVTYVVDRQGRLAFRLVGGRDLDDRAIVERLRELVSD